MKKPTSGMTKKEAPKSPPSRSSTMPVPKPAKPQRELTPKRKPTTPTTMPASAPADARAWHSMPYEKRMAMLQAGTAPSFINPASVDARMAWLERIMGRESQRKNPLLPATRPKTPPARRR